MQTRWSDRFAQRTLGMKRSEVRELLKLTEQPGVSSFGGVRRRMIRTTTTA